MQNSQQAFKSENMDNEHCWILQVISCFISHSSRSICSRLLLVQVWKDCNCTGNDTYHYTNVLLLTESQFPLRGLLQCILGGAASGDKPVAAAGRKCSIQIIDWIPSQFRITSILKSMNGCQQTQCEVLLITFTIT